MHRDRLTFIHQLGVVSTCNVNILISGIVTFVCVILTIGTNVTGKDGGIGQTIARLTIC